MTEALIKKLKNIEVLVMDVDGVLTNGQINIDNNGNERKIFNVYDGYGIVLFHRAGFKTAIISARETEAVTLRAKDLNITKVYQNARPKTKAFYDLLKDLNVEDQKVCFIGDDLPDICLFEKVGVAISVPNGVVEARTRADFVTQTSGGQGVVREVVEMLMKAKGLWEGTVQDITESKE